jgi:hypothetical protein
MNILEKLQLIQTTLHVHKGQRNNFGKYNYRSAEDILEAIKPISKETKVMFKITEELVELGGYLAIKSTATIYDLEEQSVSSISSDAYAIIDFDAKGMQNPQRTGSSSSYAKKYALGNLLLIDDTKDSDATNDHSKAISKPQLKLGTENFNNALKAIKSGKFNVSDIEKKYSLNESVKKALTSRSK